VFFHLILAHKMNLYPLIDEFVPLKTLMHSCRDFGRQVAVATKFLTLMPNISGSLVWNFLHVTLLARRILTTFLCFWKLCAALKLAPESINRSSDWLVAGRPSVRLHCCLKLDQTPNQPPSLLCYMNWCTRASFKSLPRLLPSDIAAGA
jgi:hypothetical protein